MEQTKNNGRSINPREIKFRVWNTKKKAWEHPPGYETNLLGETIIFGEFFTSSLDELSDWLPLQYTGLEDNNGKEVYEGDIVEYSDGDGEKEKGVVEFEEGGFSVTSLKIGDTYTLHFILDVDGEVVGNIFENPKLLKKV